MIAGSITFTQDSLTPNLRRMPHVVDAGVDLAFDAMQPVAESHMRGNAPWTDRTGNARGGLRAKHEAHPMVSHELILYHTMPYGIWLEVRFSGRYAIIAPSVQILGPETMDRVIASVRQAMSIMGAL